VIKQRRYNSDIETNSNQVKSADAVILRVRSNIVIPRSFPRQWAMFDVQRQLEQKIASLWRWGHLGEFAVFRWRWGSASLAVSTSRKMSEREIEFAVPPLDLPYALHAF